MDAPKRARSQKLEARSQRVREKLRNLARRLLARQEGIALATVLLLSTVILSLGTFGSRSAQTELRIARNDLLTKKALGVAEGGMNHAIGLIKGDVSDGLDDELSSGGTGGGLASLASSTTTLQEPDGTSKSYLFQAFGGSGSSDGYYVRAEDNYDETTGTNVSGTDIDNTIKVISRGRVSGAERRIEGLIKIQTGPECAMTTNGSLTISGNSEFEGTNGCAHSNNSMTISGNPEFEVGPTASGTMSISGNPEVDGTTVGSAYATENSGQDDVSIPSVRPFQFGSSGLNLATEVATLSNGYRLDDDCTVRQGGTWTYTENPPDCDNVGGTVVADLHSDPPNFGSSPSVTSSWNGWECTKNDITALISHADCDDGSCANSLWKVSGDSVSDGAFFVEGWVKISGNPGSPSTPWRATIIAMNSIDISGNPDMVPFTTTGNLQNIFLVSGNDVELSGNLGADGAPGAIFAHQQIKFSGNPDLNGFVIAEDGATTWTGDPAPSCSSNKDLLTCGANAVSGNVDITYNGNVTTSLYPPTLKLMAWNEVRN